MIKNIVALVLGVAIGASGVYFYEKVFNKKDRPRAITKVNSLPNKNKPHLKYINPLVYSSEYNQMYFDEMLGFKSEILQYLNDFPLQNQAYEIGFYFMDLTTGASVGFNEKTKFTPASLMKVPILVALYKESERVPKFLEKRVNFNKKLNKLISFDDEFQFEVGMDYSLSELGRILVEYSDNRAAVMLLNEIGFEKVIEVQNDLGFGIPGNTDGTERVIGVKTYASIFRILYNASYLSKASSDSVLQLLMTPRYIQGVRRAIPADIPVAHKFGIRILTDADGKEIGIDQLHHFGIVYRTGKPYLIGIMMKGDDREKMENATVKIIQRIDKEIESRTLEIQKSGVRADLR